MNIEYVREVVAQYRGPRRASETVRHPAAAADFIRKVLPDNAREHFVALYLDGAHRVIAFSVVATGTATSCPIHPREVFQNAVLSGAVAVILSHNHPSGEVNPSQEDRAVTQLLKEAGTLLAIKVLDHLIVSEDAFYSFSEANSW